MRKRTKIISIVSVVVLAVAASTSGYFAWQHFTEPQPIEATETTAPMAVPEEEDQTPAIMPEEIVNTVIETLSQTYELKDTEIDNRIEIGQLGITTMSKYDLYKRSFGADFDIPDTLKTGQMLNVYEGYDTGQNGETVYRSTISADVRQTIEKILEEKYNLVHTDTEAISGTDTSYKIYENIDTTCATTEVSSEETGSILRCDNKKDNAASLKNAETFYDLLPEEDTEMLRLSAIATKNSPHAGYKIGLASIAHVGEGGGREAYFYQTPDEAWHFFKYTQQGLFCNELTQPEDLRKAFENHPCTPL